MAEIKNRFQHKKKLSSLMEGENHFLMIILKKFRNVETGFVEER